jgi:hypothetical protein
MAKKHHWVISAPRPDFCLYCGAARGGRPEVEQEECPGFSDAQNEFWDEFDRAQMRASVADL